MRQQLLGSACSFLEPFGPPAQVSLTFTLFLTRWLKVLVLFALLFLSLPRFVVGFGFFWRIAGH